MQTAELSPRGIAQYDKYDSSITANGYSLLCSENNISVDITKLVENDTGISAEMKITKGNNYWPLIQCRINLLSLPSRSKSISELLSREKKVQWENIIDQISFLIIEKGNYPLRGGKE